MAQGTRMRREDPRPAFTILAPSHLPLARPPKSPLPTLRTSYGWNSISNQISTGYPHTHLAIALKSRNMRHEPVAKPDRLSRLQVSEPVQQGGSKAVISWDLPGNEPSCIPPPGRLVVRLATPSPPVTGRDKQSHWAQHLTRPSARPCAFPLPRKRLASASTSPGSPPPACSAAIDGYP